MILAYIAEKQGQSVLISCSDGDKAVLNDWGGLISFLLQRCDMAVVWNVDRFVGIISGLFPKEIRDKLKEGGRHFLPDKTKLYYQPNRMFGITYVSEVNFYSLNRYADIEPRDALELLALAERVIRAYKELGINATKLTSPVAVFSLDNVDYPRACDLPGSSQEMIEWCSNVMTREWRDVFRLGHWNADEISDYDIRGAYPSVIAELPDLSEAEFFASDYMPMNYSWGELHGKLTITKPVSPFFYQPKGCYPMGTWGDSITTDQLWLLNKYDIGHFELERGWFYTIPESPPMPFKNLMRKLYQVRETGSPLASLIAKLISVGVGGKFAQRYDDGKLGDDFNSIYARMTTSRCMVRVASFIYHNHMEESLVSCMVDGCLTTNRLPIVNRKELGTWRINEPSPFLVASLLYQWGADKRPLSKTYPEIMEMIKKKPSTSVYGDLDLNMLEYGRHFDKLPKKGGELLGKKYTSEPYEVRE